ncbi:MAG: arabinosidase, partial [Prevotella sp.]|nr:arabinosidase [Prevotella sp.]
QSDHYPERYIQFYNAIKAKYPYVQCIGNVESWSTDFPSWRNDYPVDMVDEHYYRNPKWFADRFNKYDTYDRTKHKVYVGEYAVTSNFGEIGNLNAALGEAVYMMGMENNSDVVVMNSYAPIFVNENDARWRPDMIRFNSSKAMGTPSYYVQQLFPNNIGTQVVKTNWTYSLSNPAAEEEQGKPVQVGLAT